MTRAEALKIIDNAEGSDRVAKILSLDPGTMVDVLLAINPGIGIVEIAKWYTRVKGETA